MVETAVYGHRQGGRARAEEIGVNAHVGEAVDEEPARPGVRIGRPSVAVSGRAAHSAGEVRASQYDVRREN